MRNCLEIVQSALDEIGVPIPSTLISATDPLQRQCKALLNAAAASFRNLRTFPQLKKKHSITLSAARYQYPLPTDYYAALPQTQWDENNDWRLIGPITDAEMTDRTIGLNSITTRIAYRIFGPDLNPASTAGQFKIDPVPTADGAVLSFEYITKYMFVRSDYAVFYEVVNADSDYSLFDEDLMIAEFKWRYLRAKKKDFGEEKLEAEKLLETSVARWNGTFKGSFTNTRVLPKYDIPDGSWTL